MTIGPENLGTGPMAQDRFAAPLNDYRGVRRDGPDGADSAAGPRNGGGPGMEPSMLPSLSMDGLAEPGYPPADWLDSPAPTGTMADHPLLRGLLLELPPKGIAPDQAWLDRWFEAARSILELLYEQEALRR
ncbi:hypothetical protein [Rhizomonospora bruguierae]|uniref:hypothetical protein n=1 Tax=Rhizomonospora bruguierae TaxID=1581705 RepID=UPI001BCC415F|nr:hypothetical protein [Micromonospora sp. NBRC 107566]